MKNSNSIYSPLYYITNQAKVKARLDATRKAMSSLPKVFTSDEFYEQVCRYDRGYNRTYTLGSLRHIGAVELDHQEVSGYSTPNAVYSVVFVDGYVHDFPDMPSQSRAMRECPGHGTVGAIHATFGEAVPTMCRNYYRWNVNFSWEWFIAQQKDKLVHCAAEMCAKA